MTRKSTLLLRVLPVALMAIGVAHATTVVPPSFEELVSQADSVIDGQVTALRSELVHQGTSRLVYTYVSVDVLDTVKGAAKASLELKLLGGTVGDYTMQVDGVPQFHMGDRDILFVVGNGEQFCPLVAIMHGRYPIITRPGDNAEIVLRNSGVPLAEVADVSRPMAHGAAIGSNEWRAALASGMTVADFKSQIRKEVDREQAK